MSVRGKQAGRQAGSPRGERAQPVSTHAARTIMHMCSCTGQQTVQSYASDNIRHDSCRGVSLHHAPCTPFPPKLTEQQATGIACSKDVQLRRELACVHGGESAGIQASGGQNANLDSLCNVTVRQSSLQQSNLDPRQKQKQMCTCQITTYHKCAHAPTRQI